MNSNNCKCLFQMTHNVYLTTNLLGTRNISLDTARANINMQKDSETLGEF